MELILEYAERLEVREFVSARDIMKGNTKLNLAFVAHLFNNYPSLDWEVSLAKSSPSLLFTILLFQLYSSFCNNWPATRQENRS